MLLCHRTGDLYIYMPNRKAWEPRYNVGMHYRPANDLDEMARRVIARPKFKVKEIDRSFDMIKSNRNEKYCNIERDKVGHYLFNKVKSTFLVCTSSKWRPHPYLSLSAKRKFTILADAETYEIIELDHIIGCLFEIDIKNSDHVQIVKNFTLQMAKKVRCQNYITPSLASCVKFSDQEGQSAQDEIGLAIYEEYTRRLESQLARGCDLNEIDAEMARPIDVYKHSGMAIRKDRLTETAACNSIRKHTSSREYGKANDSAFMKTDDKKAFRQRAKIYKGDLKDAYDQCFNLNRTKTADNQRMRDELNIEEKYSSTSRDNHISNDGKMPVSLSRIESKSVDKKYYSFQHNTNIELEYERRSKAFIDKQNKIQTKRRKLDTIEMEIGKSNNSIKGSEVSFC